MENARNVNLRPLETLLPIIRSTLVFGFFTQNSLTFWVGVHLSLEQ